MAFWVLLKLKWVGDPFLCKVVTDRYTFLKYLMCPLSLIPVNSLYGLSYVVLKSCTVGLHIQETKKNKEKVCVIECVGPNGPMVWSKMPWTIFGPISPLTCLLLCVSHNITTDPVSHCVCFQSHMVQLSPLSPLFINSCYIPNNLNDKEYRVWLMFSVSLSLCLLLFKPCPADSILSLHIFMPSTPSLRDSISLLLSQPPPPLLSLWLALHDNALNTNRKSGFTFPLFLLTSVFGWKSACTQWHKSVWNLM